MNSNKNNEMDSTVFLFGDYSLDANRRELRLSGEEIELQPRVFDLLVYLLTHRERAVGKDELQDAVWPGMVISDTAMTRAVMKARKAVGDDASKQEVIRTLHGHGYRFVASMRIAEVSDAVSEQVADSEPAPEKDPAMKSARPSSGYGRKFDFRGIIVAGLLSIAVIIFATLNRESWWPEESPGQGIRLAVLPVQNDTDDPELAWTPLGLMSFTSSLLGAEGEIAVVPDGSVVSLADSFNWNGSLEDDASADFIERLRRGYGATHIVEMQLLRDGRTLRMNYVLLDADGRQSKGTMVGEDATELAKGVVQALYGSVLRKTRMGTDIPLVSADPFNNEAYARGMSLSMTGRCNEAIQFFRVILEQEPELVAPRLELAACLRILGQGEEAEPLLLQLVEEQSLVGASRPLARSLMTLGILYNRTGRLDEAEASLRRALEISRAIPDPDLNGRILQNLAIVAEDRNDWDGSAEFLDLAQLEYQRAGREILPGQLYSARANLEMDRGELIQADVYLAQALKAFRAIGDRRNEAMMLNNTGYLRRLQGRLDEAEDYHLQSLTIRQEIGDRVGVGRVYGMLCSVYMAHGEYERARESALKAIAIARETSDRLFEGTSLANLGDAEKALGNIEAARVHYLEGREVFAAIQDRMRVMQSDLKLAQLELADGATGAAEQAAIRVLTDSRELDLIQSEVQAMELLGDVALARGDSEAAIVEYEEALDRVRKSSWTAKEITLLHKLASLLMDQGTMDAAAPLIGALSRQEENIPSLKTQARYSFLAGDYDAAAKMMERARVLAGQSWSEESEALLQKYRGEN